MKINDQVVKVGDILRHSDLTIRVTEMPATGGYFSACVLKSAYGNVGHTSDDFNKLGWSEEGVSIMKEVIFRKGEIVRGANVDVLVTGPGSGPEQFSGTIISIIQCDGDYEGPLVVGDTSTTFNTTHFQRGAGNGLFINQLPDYKFGVGDLVMCDRNLDGFGYVIRVLKMDSHVYFSGMIIDGSADAEDVFGEVREFFRISQFYKVTATYTRGE